MRDTIVKVHETNNATKAEAKAFRAAAVQFEIEINDPDFWYEVAQVYNGWTHKKELPEYRYMGQSFKEFKEMVLSGVDVFNVEKDYQIDISVNFYYSFRSVVGYTTPSTWLTWVNRRIFKGFDLGDIAGNQAHEYLHNLGLGHPGTDKNSVTYQFGYMIRDRIKARLKDPNTIDIYYRRSFWERVKSFFRRYV